MNTHIVRVNESIETIALLYQLDVYEIISLNNHIIDWNKLIPGTKLRLPEIPSIVMNELDNTEPFIEEYYPRIENIEQVKEKEIEEKPVQKKKHYVYPYYGYYPYYQERYYRKRKTNR